MVTRTLKKELNLFNIYAIATGTTLSTGFFLLSSLAFKEAGPAVVLSYLLAIVPLIPAMFSIVELATAMPRAGGTYYFLDRSMGPFIGTIGGFGTWLALIFKTAFSLLGMGAYLSIFWPEISLITVGVVLAVGFGLINLIGTKKVGTIQVFFVVFLVLILSIFISFGIPEIQYNRFDGFFDKGTMSIFSTAGLVFISYVGVTNIASVAEEIKDPERNLPIGVFLAITTAIIIYGLGTMIMVGVLPANELAQSLTPVASTAEALFGKWGKAGITIAAIISFASVANAGILSASRYPLAMSRDHLIPRRFSRITARGIPHFGVVMTVGLIILLLLTFDITMIAKLASSFQLLMFSLISLSVIIMRESRIESYDPGFRSPLYPWMQIFGFFSPLWLIVEMGFLAISFSLALLTFGTVWYISYAHRRVVRTGAIFHLFARLGEFRFQGLDQELRVILKEKGLREDDPFDEVVARAKVIDIKQKCLYENIVEQVSYELAHLQGLNSEILCQEFLEGNRIGLTPVSRGAALPHIRLKNIDHPAMVLVRSQHPIMVEIPGESEESREEGPLYAFFFFISPKENPGLHLRILAQLAGKVDTDDFLEEWFVAENEQELKEILLRDERFLSIRLTLSSPAESLIGHAIKDIQMPEGILIALIRRKGKMIIPHGYTLLHEGDRLTFIGDNAGIEQLKKTYGK